MLLEVQDVAALDLCEATGEGRTDRVESLLAAGVHPNARFDNLKSVFSGVAKDWASEEKSARPPLFSTRLNNLPFAEPRGSPKPIFKYRYVRLYSGQIRDEEVDNEAIDLDQISFARRGTIEKALRLERKRRNLEQGVYDPNRDEFIRDFEASLNDAIEYLDLLINYGVRSVTHALLEGGMLVQPTFDFLGNTLDVVAKDREGKTPIDIAEENESINVWLQEERGSMAA